MLKIGAIVATPFLASALFLGATGVLLVDVREGGPDGTHIVIPVPLIVAQAALSLAPEEARYVKCEDLGQYQEIGVRLAEELARCPTSSSPRSWKATSRCWCARRASASPST